MAMTSSGGLALAQAIEPAALGRRWRRLRRPGVRGSMLAAASVTRTLALPSDLPAAGRKPGQPDPGGAAPTNPTTHPRRRRSRPRSPVHPTSRAPPRRKNDRNSAVHESRPPPYPPCLSPPAHHKRLSSSLIPGVRDSPHALTPTPDSRPTQFPLPCRRRPVPTCAQNSLRRRRRLSLRAACRFLRAAPTGHEHGPQVGRRDPAQAPGSPYPAGPPVGVPGRVGRPAPTGRTGRRSWCARATGGRWPWASGTPRSPIAVRVLTRRSPARRRWPPWCAERLATALALRRARLDTARDQRLPLGARRGRPAARAARRSVRRRGRGPLRRRRRAGVLPAAARAAAGRRPAAAAAGGHRPGDPPAAAGRGQRRPRRPGGARERPALRGRPAARTEGRPVPRPAREPGRGGPRARRTRRC